MSTSEKSSVGQSTQNEWANIGAVSMSIFAALGVMMYSLDPALQKGTTAIDDFWLAYNASGNNGEGTTVYTYLTSWTQWSRALSLLFFLSGGIFFGHFISHIPANWLGRRWAIIIFCLVFCVGMVMQQIFSQSTETHAIFLLYLVGHVVAGLGLGAAVNEVLLYQYECAPKRIRGRILGIYGCTILICLLTLFTTTAIEGRASVVCRTVDFVWAFVLSTSFFLLPESPHWLVRQGNFEGAICSLARLTGLPVSDPEIELELENIKAGLYLD
ncbi:general substrate transporter [Gymnopus androsaceus JB14]|uniref:General substrate transporter n=1 Tax=Gymnopus androsaceus JB14 TaxID=1447944 RepID=A0A6A4GZS4_9AGAR|nr:general substrate transporter [Gymnopus androsaceus JB14]